MMKAALDVPVERVGWIYSEALDIRCSKPLRARIGSQDGEMVPERT